jgi:hypothetical protein
MSTMVWTFPLHPTNGGNSGDREVNHGIMKGPQIFTTWRYRLSTLGWLLCIQDVQYISSQPLFSFLSLFHLKALMLVHSSKLSNGKEKEKKRGADWICIEHLECTEASPRSLGLSGEGRPHFRKLE